MTDEAARTEALNIGHSYIVQAPAGSGKTTLLISRYICLLAVAEQPEEVLAITFTRKATAEMRKRVIDVLDPENHNPFPQEEANRAVATVRERSVQLGWNLLEQPSRLQIMTIDALCTSLVRCMPWGSRFGSLPGISQDSQQLYEAAVLNLYESAHQHEDLSEALRRLLRHLDNNSSKLQELIVQLLLKRDQWLRHLLESSFSEQDRYRLEESWHQLITQQLSDTFDRMPESVRTELGVDNFDNSHPGTVNDWKVLANRLLTLKGTWRANLGKQLREDCQQIPGLDQRLVEIRDYFPSPFYDKDQWRYYETDQWRVLRACSVVLQYAVAALKVEFRKHGQVDFIEIAMQAVAALGDAENPTDLSLVLDYQYRHIMVDEFQDTSFSQRNLLELLTAGWQHDDGRTIFLVGDPMQSIYRFREAEVGIYLKVMKRGLGNLTIRPLRLTQNFRSNRDLVGWFNQVFAPSFPARMELQTGSVPYADCTTANHAANSQAISIWLQRKLTRNEQYSTGLLMKDVEADQLLADLKDFREQNPDPDIRAAILVRSRGHANEIIARLVKDGIKFYAPEFIPLSERPVVEDLLALTRALLNLADRTAWMAVLRAPWCGLTLADMLVIADDKYSLIWDRLGDSAVRSALSEPGCEQVKRLYEVFTRTFAARGRLGIRQWVQDCWLLLGGPACGASHDYENAQLFFDLIDKYAKGHAIEGLHRFEEKIAELYAVPEVGPDDTWLQISTIHSAKGLEYDAVFLPRFHADRIGFPTTPLLVWSEFFQQEGDGVMLLSPIVSTGQDKEGTLYKFLMEWDKKRDRIELMRLAYVACTRAKQALYIYGATKFGMEPTKEQALAGPPSKGSLLQLMWPGIVETGFTGVHWEPNMTVQDSPQPEANDAKFPILRLPFDWQLPNPPASVEMLAREYESPEHWESIDFDWAGSVALWIGNVVHEWLEKIVRTGMQEWNRERLAAERSKWRIRLQAMGLRTDHAAMDEALDRIEMSLNKVLLDPKGQWILSGEHDESEVELRLTGVLDNQFTNVILDRTFVDEHGTRWIIDYKSGTTGGNVESFLDQEVDRYRDQLIKYKSIVAGMDPRPIRLALYFPMFPAWREVLEKM